VDAEVETEWWVKKEDLIQKSKSLVIHPHGSIYLYPVESDISKPDSTNMHWLTLKDEPIFIFDPDCNTSLFGHYYGRPVSMHGYQHPDERFIPPLNDKSGSLEDRYYKILMEKAITLVKRSDIIVSIGYSFADTDICSYEAFLSNLFRGGKSLTIISPGAEEITERLYKRYNHLSPDIVSIPLTFAQWAENGFELVAHAASRQPKR
jgi:hypothetical protein